MIAHNRTQNSNNKKPLPFKISFCTLNVGLFVARFMFEREQCQGITDETMSIRFGNEHSRIFHWEFKGTNVINFCEAKSLKHIEHVIENNLNQGFL